MRFASLLLLLLCGPVAASDWTTGDTVREGEYLIALAVDCGQTHDQIDRSQLHGGTYYELNPIVGRYPSRQRVDRFVIGSAILHPLVSALLPPDWRHAWQYLTIAAEVAVDVQAYKIGLAIKF
jgi:hypothetical protein